MRIANASFSRPTPPPTSSRMYSTPVPRTLPVVHVLVSAPGTSVPYESSWLLHANGTCTVIMTYWQYDSCPVLVLKGRYTSAWNAFHVEATIRNLEWKIPYCRMYACVRIAPLCVSYIYILSVQSSDTLFYSSMHTLYSGRSGKIMFLIVAST